MEDVIPFSCSCTINRLVIASWSSEHFLVIASSSSSLLLTRPPHPHIFIFRSSIASTYSSNSSTTVSTLLGTAPFISTLLGTAPFISTPLGTAPFTAPCTRDRTGTTPSSAARVWRRGGEDMGLERLRGAGGDVASLEPILGFGHAASSDDDQVPLHALAASRLYSSPSCSTSNGWGTASCHAYHRFTNSSGDSGKPTVEIPCCGYAWRRRCTATSPSRDEASAEPPRRESGTAPP